MSGAEVKTYSIIVHQSTLILNMKQLNRVYLIIDIKLPGPHYYTIAHVKHTYTLPHYANPTVIESFLHGCFQTQQGLLSSWLLNVL